MISARDRILRPYTRRVHDLRHSLLKTLAVFLLIMTAMFMGFWLAVFGTLVAQPFFILVGILFVVALWMMDDTEPDYRAKITTLLMWYVVLEATWPSYVAVDIPGLPWLTPPRMLLAVMMFFVTLQLAQSSRARSAVIEVGGAAKLGLWFLGIFWATAFATCLISRTPSASFVMLVEWFLLWNMPFLVACLVFREQEAFPRFVKALIWATAFIFVLTIFEYIQRKPVWFGYIPSFMKIDGPLYHAIMQEQVRIGDNRYRARGVFAVHLYFAQYILLVTPFILHRAIESSGWQRFWAWALLAFTLLIIWMTNTRTGMSGFILVCAGMVGLYALRRFLNPTNKGDMVAPGIFLAAPVGMMAFGVLVALSPRLQTMTIGGAQTRSSDLGRDMQWIKGTAALKANPFGYGGGNSGPLAGRMAGDRYIIDSLWLNFMLDFGVIAFGAFMLFMLVTVYYGVRMYLTATDQTTKLMGPAAVAVGGFILTTYTISFAGNLPLLMIIVGGIYAFRQHQLRTAAQAAPVKPVRLSQLLPRSRPA